MFRADGGWRRTPLSDRLHSNNPLATDAISAATQSTTAAQIQERGAFAANTGDATTALTTAATNQTVTITDANGGTGTAGTPTGPGLDALATAVEDASNVAANSVTPGYGGHSAEVALSTTNWAASSTLTLTIGNGADALPLSVAYSSAGFEADLAAAVNAFNGTASVADTGTRPDGITLSLEGTTLKINQASTGGGTPADGNTQIQVSGATFGGGAVGSATINNTALTGANAAYVQVAGGTLTFAATDEITSVTSSAAAATNLFGVDAGKEGAIGIANSSTSAGNNVAAQTLMINGQTPKTVAVAENASARDIAAAINGVASETGVQASARTNALLSGLSANGVVSFNLNGTDISAAITTTDMSNLADALNAKTSGTGVIAKLSVDKQSITLEAQFGDDIAIKDFTSSAATATSPVSLNVQGLKSAEGIGMVNSGLAVRLSDDKSGAADSTVIGGEVEFKSPGNYFSVSSSLDAISGGLFQGTANQLQAGALQDVKSIDIATVETATRALDIIDGALAKVNGIRADLGAVQNRFEATISNLQINSENLSAARSRIRDTDFASETANLTRAQILQQAGTAMLAQANALPNQVLSLLQG